MVNIEHTFLYNSLYKIEIFFSLLLKHANPFSIVTFMNTTNILNEIINRELKYDSLEQTIMFHEMELDKFVVKLFYMLNKFNFQLFTYNSHQDKIYISYDNFYNNICEFLVIEDCKKDIKITMNIFREKTSQPDQLFVSFQRLNGDNLNAQVNIIIMIERFIVNDIYTPVVKSEYGKLVIDPRYVDNYV